MIVLSTLSGVKSLLWGSRVVLSHGFLAIERMLDLGGVIEIDEDQVGPCVVAARIDDGGRADAVEKRSGNFGAFVDVPVQRQARLVSMRAERAQTLKEVFDSIRSRPRISLPKGVTIKSLIEEGRRF